MRIIPHALNILFCLCTVRHEAKLSPHLAAKHIHDDRVAQLGKFKILSPCSSVFWQTQNHKWLQTSPGHD